HAACACVRIGRVWHPGGECVESRSTNIRREGTSAVRRACRMVGRIVVRKIIDCMLPFALTLALVACSSPRLSDAEKGEFDRMWRLHGPEDSTWPAARDQWLARGGEARSVLIENLLADMVRSQSIRTPSQAAPWERPQHELALIGDEVIPYALTTMSIRASDEP